uniref:Uncharacterized protein n=1 Tax=Romanomermis culicivorax TaxID=13658 RepID=A0A915I4D3_ROMCU
MDITPTHESIDSLARVDLTMDGLEFHYLCQGKQIIVKLTMILLFLSLDHTDNQIDIAQKFETKE